MLIGIQTRPWGPEANRTRLGDVLADVAAAGYDGFEIGQQHLDLSRPDILRDLAAAHGLQVAAVHVGGDLTDANWTQQGLDLANRVAAYAAAVGAPCMAFSGQPKPGKSADEYRLGADILNRVGEVARDHGVRLAYHNHWWEIQDGLAELRALVALTDPALVSLCLDVAWVLRGGGDPAAVAREFGDRIAYFHLKDTRGDEWLELGQGDLDFAALFDVLRARHDPWAVVEQDETRRSAIESARMSRAFLRERLA